ncbi:MAG TPA: serine--tRNA ligase, partial [Alphaproteobacteria bacterium]|nr:serine--tRNA ligase [Alphaproteobacteria bacterium]
MHDLKSIRDNPEAFDRGLARRGLEPLSPKILAIDTRRRAEMTRAQELQAERNRLSKEIGAIKARGGDAAEIMAKVAASKDGQALAEAGAAELERELNVMLATVPNLPADDVPEG